MRVNVLPGVLSLLTLAAAPQPPTPPPLSPAQMLTRMLASERAFLHRIARFQPRVETYIQTLGPDPDRGTVPISDAYFLGILHAGSHLREPLFVRSNSGPSAREFYPLGFAAVISPDRAHLDRRHYRFIFAGRQFLGAVRCVVFNVMPRSDQSGAAFIGRIWAEDQGFHIVRFDGTYIPNSHHHYVHFDSWRAQMGPGLWLPVAIYTQESALPTGWFGHIDFQGQTRFWGYQLSASSPSALAQISVDASPQVAPPPTSPLPSPLAQERAWRLKAENDVLDRMQAAGLLAPPGPVDKVLETVVRNLEITNRLSLDPPVRARILLTAPLESFTVGHTIVLSRGLLDVLPDEASLAMILAHELGNIVLDHTINTDYAFDDRMMFPDDQLFARIRMTLPAAAEAAADAKGLDLLRHSPYQDQLAQAGLFLEALQHAAAGLPNLITAHMGDALVIHGKVVRMRALIDAAPRLQTRNLHQIAALPLGARIQLNPWNDRLRLIDAPAENLLSAQDKLNFQITPYMPYLTREPAAQASKAATLASAAAHH